MLRELLPEAQGWRGVGFRTQRPEGGWMAVKLRPVLCLGCYWCYLHCLQIWQKVGVQYRAEESKATVPKWGFENSGRRQRACDAQLMRIPNAPPEDPGEVPGPRSQCLSGTFTGPWVQSPVPTISAKVPGSKCDHKAAKSPQSRAMGIVKQGSTVTIVEQRPGVLSNEISTPLTQSGKQRASK